MEDLVFHQREVGEGRVEIDMEKDLAKELLYSKMEKIEADQMLLL